MSLFTTCPACGSDWCSGAECLREKLRAAETRESALVSALKAIDELAFQLSGYPDGKTHANIGAIRDWVKVGIRETEQDNGK